MVVQLKIEPHLSMFGETEFTLNHTDRYSCIDFVSNNGQNTLVFLHGMFGGLSNFDPLIKELQGYSIFVPQIPIYEFERVELDIPALSGWLHGVLKEHGISRPVLLGNSMGGHIALDYAIRFPAEVGGLILTGSSGLFENNLGSTKPKRYDRDYVRERAALTFYDDLVNDTIVDEILEVLQTPFKLGRLLKIARATHEYNLEDQLYRITHPVLLVWGRDDVITPPRVADLFKDKLPNASLRWIDRCGHAPMMERPVEFAKFLVSFLGRADLHSTNERSRYEDYSHC